MESNCYLSELINLLGTTDLARPELEPELVHRIRVAIKKNRAWLKFYRADYGKTTAYRDLVSGLRDLSRGLAFRRDQYVLVETLEKLAAKYPGKKVSRLIARLQRENIEQPPGQGLMKTWPAEFIAQILQGLEQFKQREVSASLQGETTRQTYKKMCVAAKHALLSEHCDDFHAWRKLVKTLGYQLELAGDACSVNDKRTERITQLGKKLGELHDLCYLNDQLDHWHLASLHDLDLAPVYNRILKERTGLLKKIGKLQQQVCQHIM